MPQFAYKSAPISDRLDAANPSRIESRIDSLLRLNGKQIIANRTRQRRVESGRHSERMTGARQWLGRRVSRPASRRSTPYARTHTQPASQPVSQPSSRQPPTHMGRRAHVADRARRDSPRLIVRSRFEHTLFCRNPFYFLSFFSLGNVWSAEAKRRAHVVAPPPLAWPASWRANASHFEQAIHLPATIAAGGPLDPDDRTTALSSLDHRRRPHHEICVAFGGMRLRHGAELMSHQTHGRPAGVKCVQPAEPLRGSDAPPLARLFRRFSSSFYSSGCLEVAPQACVPILTVSVKTSQNRRKCHAAFPL